MFIFVPSCPRVQAPRTFILTRISSVVLRIQREEVPERLPKQTRGEAAEMAGAEIEAALVLIPTMARVWRLACP